MNIFSANGCNKEDFVVTVVGIRFKKACKIYFFDPAETGVDKGDFAIVETARGVEYGEAVIGRRELADEQVVHPLKPVIRKATSEDTRKYEESKNKEKEAFSICESKIKVHNLNMRLVDVEFTFDVNKIIFYFTAEGRIDFRELVKDLAAVFRTRIELRQIGVRDQAKMLNGIGCCGRSLCCATFLGDFEPVSIRMAKDQNLSLNPTKISGICSRLMCCLKYENYLYTDEKSCDKCTGRHVPLPKVGGRVITPIGEGTLLSLNKKERTASVKLTEDNIVTVTFDEMTDATSAEVSP
jgi:cell fate regulator YaaT (PSP1 superfamily)